MQLCVGTSDSAQLYGAAAVTRPARGRWQIAVECCCYAMAFAMPSLLRPIIYGTLVRDDWRGGAMAAVVVTFIATGILVRVRRPASWAPLCALACLSGVLTSPWHVLTVCIAVLAIAVMFATQAWPRFTGRRRNATSGNSILILVGASIGVGYALLRMSLVAGFPLCFAQALANDQCALVYLRDNPRALAEYPPGGVPWPLYAAKHCDPLVLEAVLAAGAPFKSPDPQFAKPLEWFAANVDFSDRDAATKAQLLVRYGAKPAGADVAARRGFATLVRALLELGDDPNAADEAGRTALGRLIEANAVTAVSCLFANGVHLAPTYGTVSQPKLISVPSPAMWAILSQYGQSASAAILKGNPL